MIRREPKDRGGRTGSNASLSTTDLTFPDINVESMKYMLQHGVVGCILTFHVEMKM
jgi:hypothetical protein